MSLIELGTMVEILGNVNLEGEEIIISNIRKGKSKRTSVMGSSIVEDTVEVEIGEDETKNGVNLFDDLFSLNGSDSDGVDQPKKKWS